MDFLASHSIEEIQEIIDKSFSYNDVLYNLGVSPNSGPNYCSFKRFLSAHPEISVEKMLENKAQLANKMQEDKTRAIFCSDSHVTQKVLRNAYHKIDTIEYKCTICGQGGTWNGKPLTLTLDHIDGNNHNNLLSNLRRVCPNCDRQLPTFGAKNKKPKIYFCKQCGAQISKTKNGLCKKCSGWIPRHLRVKETNKCMLCGKPINTRAAHYCVDCYKKTQALLSNIPERDELKRLIRTTPFTTIAKQFNVSDKTICKWCKKYSLPYKSHDIKMISDTDWNQI